MMNTRYIVALAVVAIIAVGGVLLAQERSHESVQSTSGGSQPSATSTATSTVAGTYPALVPASPKKGTVQGTVMLGPSYPVERIPPDPQCADRPYQTTIRVEPVDSSAPPSSVRSDASGSFSISLAPSTYLFTPQGGGGVPPTCRSQQVTIVSGKIQKVALSCDTGIR